MISMADQEISWLDEAFNDEPPKQAPKHAASSSHDSDESFDWIDDAFDDTKEDPLAKKGMTGCSGTAVALAAVAVVAVAAFAFLAMIVIGGLASTGTV